MRAIFHKYKRTVSRPQAGKMYISLGSARIQYVAKKNALFEQHLDKQLSRKCNIKTQPYKQIIEVHDDFKIMREWQ